MRTILNREIEDKRTSYNEVCLYRQKITDHLRIGISLYGCLPGSSGARACVRAKPSEHREVEQHQAHFQTEGPNHLYQQCTKKLDQLKSFLKMVQLIDAF